VFPFTTSRKVTGNYTTVETGYSFSPGNEFQVPCLYLNLNILTWQTLVVFPLQ